jgi:hypothetical protein
MKFKAVLVLVFLVTASLISFSNRCNTSCDGRKMIVMRAQQAAEDKEASLEKRLTPSSPLLRIAVTL